MNENRALGMMRRRGFTKRDVDEVIALWRSTGDAVAIARALEHKYASLPTGMDMLQVAFGLELNEASLFAGWYADGSGEVKDDSLREILGKYIERRFANWTFSSPEHLPEE